MHTQFLFFGCTFAPMNKTILAHLALASVALLYGANYVIAKIVLGSGLISPNGFIMLRVIGATILLWTIHPFIIKERLEKRDYLYAAFCSIFGIAVNQLCFFQGLKYTSPMHASLIMITVPMMVLFASFLILKSKITSRQILGMALGLIGAAILVVSATSSDGIASVKGDIYILINACSYALYLVLVKRLMEKYHTLTVIKWLFLFGGIIVIPFGLPDMLVADFSAFATPHWWSVVYVIIGATFLTYLFNGYALGHVKSSTVGFYVYFQPLIASFISIFIGQDTLDFPKVQAAILLFVGVYFVLYQKPRKV